MHYDNFSDDEKETLHSQKFVVAPGQDVVEGIGAPLKDRPERDQPSPTKTDFQAFGMPAPGEDDGNNGNPLAEGVIMGQDGERGFKKRDNFMGSVNANWFDERTDVTPPLWFSAKEMPADPDSPDFKAEDMDIIDPDDLPEERKDRKLETIAGGASLPPNAKDQQAANMSMIDPSITPEQAGSYLDSQGTSMPPNAQGATPNATGAGACPQCGMPEASCGCSDANGAEMSGMIPPVASVKQSFLPLLGLGGLAARAVGGGMMGGLLKGALKAAGPMGAAMNMMGDAKEQVLDQTSGQPAPPPQVAAPTEIKMPQFGAVKTAEDYESPSSKDFPNQTAEDPEDIDPKEHKDGEHEPLQVGLDVNGIGGTDGIHGLSDGLLSQFDNALPKILKYYFSDESGAEEPEIKSLADAFEKELPGWHDKADDQHGMKLITIMLNDKGGDVKTANQPMNIDPDLYPNLFSEDTNTKAAEVHRLATDLENEGYSLELAFTVIGKIAGISPHEAVGLYYGGGKTALNQPSLNMSDSTTVRPEDMKQQNAAMGGHCAKCGGTISPSDSSCPQCGSPSLGTISNTKVSDQSQGPQDDEQKALVAQFLQQQGREDEIPGMILEPFKYADELAEIIGKDAPPEGDVGGGQPQPAMEEAPPGDTMPVPGMSVPPSQQAMAKAADKYSADDHLQEHNDHFDNSVSVPASDEVAQEDSSMEEDSGHTWTDESGDPLKVGQEYEMYSANYDIPDMVRIEEVKPDSIEYTLTGEYGLEHRTEISREEALIEQLSFTPEQQNHSDEIESGSEDVDPGIEENMDDIGRPTTGVDQTDLSRPHSAGSTNRDWLKEGGAKFTPMEQREFIEEAGVARNADKLDLSGTHYEARVEIDEDYFLFGL